METRLKMVYVNENLEQHIVECFFFTINDDANDKISLIGDIVLAV